eukprot:2207246-Rhodomonas_salina.2
MGRHRFQSVMEVWVYFDKSGVYLLRNRTATQCLVLTQPTPSGNWSVSSSDVRVRSKRLAPGMRCPILT